MSNSTGQLKPAVPVRVFFDVDDNYVEKIKRFSALNDELLMPTLSISEVVEWSALREDIGDSVVMHLINQLRDKGAL